MRPLPLAVLCLAAAPASAEVPSVLADTAPVQSLVAMVMDDLGTPELILPPGTSPHEASLTPSEAQALTEADLIVWTGPEFLPWLQQGLDSLAPDTPQLALLDAPGWEPLPLRRDPHLLEADAHEHEHAEAGEAIDPHAWLDPEVAAAWLTPIAESLAAVDPEDAATYRANAAAAARRLQALRADLVARLGPLGTGGRGYAVGHDAYQYLERAAGLPAAWAVSDATGLAPAPMTVADLREAVVSGEVGCLLIDAETDPAWAATLGEGADLRAARVDPEGLSLTPGPDLYPTLIGNLADAIAPCLAP